MATKTIEHEDANVVTVMDVKFNVARRLEHCGYALADRNGCYDYVVTPHRSTFGLLRGKRRRFLFWKRRRDFIGIVRHKIKYGMESWVISVYGTQNLKELEHVAKWLSKMVESQVVVTMKQSAAYTEEFDREHDMSCL